MLRIRELNKGRKGGWNPNRCIDSSVSCGSVLALILSHRSIFISLPIASTCHTLASPLRYLSLSWYRWCARWQGRKNKPTSVASCLTTLTRLFDDFTSTISMTPIVILSTASDNTLQLDRETCSLSLLYYTSLYSSFNYISSFEVKTRHREPPCNVTAVVITRSKFGNYYVKKKKVLEEGCSNCVEGGSVRSSSDLSAIDPDCFSRPLCSN